LLCAVLGTDALDLIVGGLDVLVRQQQDLDVLAALDVQDGAALLVEQKGGGAHGQMGQDALRVLLHRLLLDDAEDRQGEGLHPSNLALAVAAGTFDRRGIPQRGAQPLARHLQ
jgi:hypothetical protein